jgi:hypothetical protein
MAWFIVRVELHDHPTGDDYDVLHEAMEVGGFSRTISGKKGGEYRLPTAEYCLAGDFAREQVCNKARRAAIQTGHPYSVLVTESNGSTWYGLERAE